MTMVDIQGLEDFLATWISKLPGHIRVLPQFKWILKIDGLTPEIIKEALFKTHKARDYILDEIMLKAIRQPRAELSPYAPKIFSTLIDVEKIRDVIGSGGKVVQKNLHRL